MVLYIVNCSTSNQKDC